MKWFLVLALLSQSSIAADVNIRVPMYFNGGHVYFLALIENALKDAGHKVIYTKQLVPQKRAIRMLDTGDLDLIWLVGSLERDASYVKVNVGLTDGLIGNRILFIGKDIQNKVNSVSSLDDLKKTGLVGGFGKNWFDIDVWKANGLSYFEKDGDWKALYRLVENRRDADYFSRGVLEILQEHEKNEFLSIERNLLLVYNRDQYLYIGKNVAGANELKGVLEDALKQYKDSGKLAAFIRSTYADTFKALNVSGRKVINLTTPK